MGVYYVNGQPYDMATKRALKPAKGTKSNRFQSATEAQREEAIMAATPPFKSRVLDTESEGPIAGPAIDPARLEDAAWAAVSDKSKVPPERPKLALDDAIHGPVRNGDFPMNMDIDKVVDAHRPPAIETPQTSREVLREVPVRIGQANPIMGEDHPSPKYPAGAWDVQWDTTMAATFCLGGARQFTVSAPTERLGDVPAAIACTNIAVERVLHALQTVANSVPERVGKPKAPRRLRKYKLVALDGNKYTCEGFTPKTAVEAFVKQHGIPRKDIAVLQSSGGLTIHPSKW